MVEWWSNQTINEYVNRTECFVEQYSRYYLPDIGEYVSMATDAEAECSNQYTHFGLLAD